MIRLQIQKNLYMDLKKTVLFPSGFLWGAATAAHQVEGGNYNDWSVWEEKNAERLAKNAGKKYKNVLLTEQNKIQAMQPRNYISGLACNHYRLYNEDFDLVQTLGIKAYRFSVEWSRVEPEEGKFSTEVLEHYKQVITALRRRGIEPFVTLWHWTLPVWLADEGGWQYSRAIACFTRFVHKVVDYLGESVNFWITLNEPQVYVGMPYFIDQPPTVKKGIISYLRNRHQLILAHKAAYQAIKKISPQAQVGIANHSAYFEGYKHTFLNRVIVRMVAWWANRYFLNRIRRYQDFIGLNYYFHQRMDGLKVKNENKKVSDLGWELFPEGLYHVVKELQGFHKPVYITEHGLADGGDKHRSWYLRESLMFLRQAMDEGVDVRGYFHWSLLDNFEWADGFWPRFGLVGIDYTTQTRTPRPSAQAYARIIKNNGFSL